jgi:transcriptional regulator with XRE-family HTH domain
MGFAEQLKKLRLASGLSQTELAGVLNTKVANINRYEAGIRKPGFRMLKILAGHFGVSTDYLLGIELEEDSLVLRNLKNLVKITANDSYTEFAEKLEDSIDKEILDLFFSAKVKPDDMLLEIIAQKFEFSVAYFKNPGKYDDLQSIRNKFKPVFIEMDDYSDVISTAIKLNISSKDLDKILQNHIYENMKSKNK